jgi:hypothetical protein
VRQNQKPLPEWRASGWPFSGLARGLACNFWWLFRQRWDPFIENMEPLTGGRPGGSSAWARAGAREFHSKDFLARDRSRWASSGLSKVPIGLVSRSFVSLLSWPLGAEAASSLGPQGPGCVSDPKSARGRGRSTEAKCCDLGHGDGSGAMRALMRGDISAPPVSPSGSDRSPISLAGGGRSGPPFWAISACGNTTVNAHTDFAHLPH